MNQEEAVKSNESVTQRQGLNTDESERVALARDVSNQTSGIFKLDVDCFEEVFDYLPLESLVSISQTCKRLQNVANYIYQQQYGHRAVMLDSDEARSFTKLVQNIEIDTESDFQEFLRIKSKFHRLTAITFHDRTKVTKMKILQMMEILKNIETLYLHGAIETDSFESLIDASPNVKRIDLCSFHFQERLPPRAWTTLEHFEFHTNYFGHGASNTPLNQGNDFGVIGFLEINPNIRHFDTDYGFIFNTVELLKSANIKLENLTIRVNHYIIDGGTIDDLNELYERGFYQQLHWYYMHGIRFQRDIDEMARLKGLVNIYFDDSIDDDINLTALNTVEELCLVSCLDTFGRTNILYNINAYTQLKCIHIERATFDDIFHIVSQAERLTQIKVTSLRDENDLGVSECSDPDRSIDIAALNKARMKLSKGRDLKVTIYVPESVYLATKWAMKGTDFGMIKLKRFDSTYGVY